MGHCLGHAWDGVWDPGYGCLGTDIPMGWALAIPPWCVPGYYPSTPGTPPPPCYSGLSVEYGPAQRLSLSVKTAFSGHPIYHVDEKRLSECNGERTRGTYYCQNVPTFLIEPVLMRFPKTGTPQDHEFHTFDGKSVVH